MDASVKYTNFLCVHLVKTTNKLVILTDGSHAYEAHVKHTLFRLLITIELMVDTYYIVQ